MKKEVLEQTNPTQEDPASVTEPEFSERVAHFGRYSGATIPQVEHFSSVTIGQYDLSILTTGGFSCEEPFSTK